MILIHNGRGCCRSSSSPSSLSSSSWATWASASLWFALRMCCCVLLANFRFWLLQIDMRTLSLLHTIIVAGVVCCCCCCYCFVNRVIEMRYKQFAIRLLENNFVCHLLVLLLLLLFYFLPPSIFIELSCVFFFFSFSFVSFSNCKCYCIYFPVVVVAVARVCMAWELQRDFLNLVNNSTAATKTILTTTTRTTADAFAK